MYSLAHIFKLQVAGAEGDGLRDALGDQPCLDAAQARERDGGAVVGVESFGSDLGLAVDPNPALAAALGGVGQNALSVPAGRGR